MTENLTDFLGNRKNVITNIDPDGIFSYALLKKCFDCDLVGFTNSKEYVYLFEGKDYTKKNVTYVDMFVKNKDIFSIDQHIVSYNENDNKELQEYGTKLNPNVWNERSFTNYRIKYPFSTFIYLGTLLDKEGYDIDIDWNKKITDDITLGHILLRIDGVLTNIVDYSENCNKWLEWSKQKSNGGKFIDGLTRFLKEKIYVLDIRKKANDVENFFKERFNSETKDGGFKSLTKENFSNIFNFFNFSFDCFNIADKSVLNNINHISVYKGERYLQIPPTEGILDADIFSYAIVNMKENNFSFTKNIKKIGVLLLS